MNTIQARVSSRLLSKASRLFTGTLEGRIIEVLQNARRAGATRVDIGNSDGVVTVRDNGRGIDDFARLLDLGASGWEQFDASEDPAGVGVFCLAPRQVSIRSRGRAVTITGDGWTGQPVVIRDDPEPIAGTLLQFEDKPWPKSTVERLAVFTGMTVDVDGNTCASEPFVSPSAAHHAELGCRIEVRESNRLGRWHAGVSRGTRDCGNVLMNFHGQTVAFDTHPPIENSLCFLVDLTGEPTGIRLMLPARTRLVENEAFAQLQRVLEFEGFRYIQRRGSHRLAYNQYQRALELGITLPEAQPTYQVGLLGSGDEPVPVEVQMPGNFPLANCYRFNASSEGDESDEANAHLLAALGGFVEPFVPVDIANRFNGYSWSDLPLIEQVKVTTGEKILSRLLWDGTITCVESLAITVHTSDGRTFSSPVCMALGGQSNKDVPHLMEPHVLVTREAMDRLSASQVWHHLGGCWDEGDTYDTQLFQFEQELDRFWMDLIGPDEHVRSRLLDVLLNVDNWRRVIIQADGCVAIQFTDRPQKILRGGSGRSGEA